MASAVLVTYERKPILSRNTTMKKSLNASNGYALDPALSEAAYASETVADSDGRRPKSVPLVASNSFAALVEPPSETASEDSCSLKRKSMSLNADSMKDTLNSVASSFGFSKDLSRDERRQLRKRLKMELQQVRSLAQKLDVRESQLKALPLMAPSQDGLNGIRLSRVGSNASVPAVELLQREGRLSRRPSLVIPESIQDGPGTGGKDKRTPKANQLYVNSEFVSGKDKLPPVEKSKSKAGSNLKRNLSAKLDARDQKRQKLDAPQSRKMGEIFKQCGAILKKLMTSKQSWLFNTPVDVVELKLHDYLKIIQKPMDLGTIKQKLDGGVYLFPTEFAEDVRLTFANAMKYNPQGHYVHNIADTLRNLFENRWKAVEEKLKGLGGIADRLAQDLKEPDIAHPSQAVVQKVSEAHTVDAKPSAAKKSKPAKTPAKPKAKTSNLPKRAMTFEEKQTLSKDLESLPVEKSDKIFQIIKNKNPSLTQTDDEIEVDIDSFDIATLWELHRFVMECKKENEQSKKTAEKALPRQQVPNGTSRIPKVNQRGGEGGEEEVDIGDDVPSGEFPPVVIDKDRGVTTTKNSSSSSSSSGSGSSSSDSDSGSSSGSDSGADDVQSGGPVPKKVSPAAKEPVGSGAVGDPRGSPALEVDGAKIVGLRSGSMSDLDEETPSAKAPLPDAESQPEGEANILGQEDFPERRLRAALLRNRFADTILKAHEKTLPLNKSERVDPEKLRKEREELERRQKEEKARLQAEARAAELARKKAEAEAAAEARRQREAEREAARLALQNMEKTVEIDENSEILKDLEMLRSAPPEHPSLGGETSPVHSPDGLSAFTLQDGNPLEQLGLFMKNDEEDEEQEVEPLLLQAHNVEGSAGDEDEEGEIED